MAAVIPFRFVARWEPDTKTKANVDCAYSNFEGPTPDPPRVDDLRRVVAHMRGLSIEPLWDRLPLAKLDLTGIDWVIVGGESGEAARPFNIEWAAEIRDHCRKKGVAFFLKQMGSNPMRDGNVVEFNDSHGGDWSEWDESLRVREFPKAFHNYRKSEMVISGKLRPVVVPNNQGDSDPEPPITLEVKAEFKRHDAIVRRGMAAFVEAGQALLAIHDGKLWRAAGHKSWEEYCRTVAGISRGHADRLLKASRCFLGLKTSPIGDVLPIAESQVRPLLRLAEPERANAWISAVEKAEGNQPIAAEVAEVVFEILHPDTGSKKRSSRVQQRISLVQRLKEEIQKKSSWEQVESLLAELERFL